MFKKTKSLLVAAVALMMLFTSVAAFGAQLNDEGALVAPGESSPVEAAITKTLRFPMGTITPSATFNFLATKISVDGNSTTDDLAKMPTLNTGNMTVSYIAADTGTNNTETNIVSVIKETDDIFAGVTFPHAGIYVYEITEIADTNLAIDDNAPDEILTYSEAKYTLTVYVANNEAGTGTYIMGLGTRATWDDSGEAAGDNKVDPTPGGNGEDYHFSQMIFVNDYVKTNTVIDPGADSTLSVGKTVTGDFASREQYFDFEISLTIPILVADTPEYYKAYIVENGAVVSPANNANSALIGTEDGVSYIKIASTGNTDFSLKHGQSLVFVDTPVGTRYVVEEQMAPNYIPSVIVTTNAVQGENVTGTISSALSTDIQLVGELLNSANFTNNRDSVTPTGLNLNDLPFIGLIALGAGSLLFFVVAKSRRRNAEAQ